MEGEVVCEMSAHDTGYGAVKLTNGYVVIEDEELRGWRIGSYCFNVVVEWAKRHFPNSEVLTIQLRSDDAVGPNKSRRNRFYEQFGIRFAYTESERQREAAGESETMVVSDLIARTPKQFPNIQELDTRHALAVSTILLPRAQERVRELCQFLSEALRETTPTRRFFRLIRYIDWMSYGLAAFGGAVAMSAWQRWIG